MKPSHAAVALGLLAAALVLANQWRGTSESDPAEAVSTTYNARRAPPAAVESAQEYDSSEPQPASDTSSSAAAPRAPAVTAQTLAAAAESIDPQLRNRNLIIPRRRDGAQDGPGFVELETQFTAETADPKWSNAAEAELLGRVSQVAGLELVSLEAECRATICRVKLFHPPGTKVRSSLDTLKIHAEEIGFGHTAEVATLGDDGVPISVFYLQRKGA